MLFVVLIVAVAVITTRRLHWQGGTALALALGGSQAMMQAFLPAKPDHHGLITAAAVCTVLCLFLAGGGFVRRVGTAADLNDASALHFLDERRARFWFVASGVSAGVGMWLSAISLSLVIAGIGLGAFLSLS